MKPTYILNQSLFPSELLEYDYHVRYYNLARLLYRWFKWPLLGYPSGKRGRSVSQPGGGWSRPCGCSFPPSCVAAGADTSSSYPVTLVVRSAVFSERQRPRQDSNHGRTLPRSLRLRDCDLLGSNPLARFHCSLSFARTRARRDSTRDKTVASRRSALRLAGFERRLPVRSSRSFVAARARRDSNRDRA